MAPRSFAIPLCALLLLLPALVPSTASTAAPDVGAELAVEELGEAPDWQGVAAASVLGLACFDVTSVSYWRVYVDASCSVSGARSYSWTWGDGSSSSTTSATTSHLYSKRGSFTICLTVDYIATTDSVCELAPRVGPTDSQLASHWAPVFYQDTDVDDWSADEITRFDFDGVGTNWRGDDNWDNEPSKSHYAYVYDYIMETSTHYFIGYMAYHPRDWETDSFGTEHENDMEGALLMIKKGSTSTYGTFVAVHTMAHWKFHPYVKSGSGVTAKTSHPHGPAQTVNFWSTTHVELGMEAGGHGMYRKEAVYNGDFNGHGIIYYPGTTAELASGSNDRNVKYALLPIDPLWDRRSNYGGSNPYDRYGVFNGDVDSGCGDGLIGGVDCVTDASRPPWGMYDEDDAGTTGIWWTDPAQYYKDRMDGLGTVSTTYLYKSYA